MACLYTVNGRNRQKLLSHSLVFLNHQPAATALPRALTSNESYIIFANLNTNEQKVAKRKHHLVRKNVTDALLSLYQKDLPRYKDIPTNTHYVEQQFQTTDSSGEPTTAESASTFSERQAAFDQRGAVVEHLCRNDNDDTAGAPSEIIRNAQEMTFRPGQVQRLDDTHVSTSSLFIPATVPNGAASRPTFCVRRSSDAVRPSDADYDVCAFPHLHRNGQGLVYDATRETKVSPDEVRRHNLSIRERMYAQDPLWKLVQFDNSNQKRAQGFMTAKLKGNPSLATAAVQVSENDLLRHGCF